MATKIIGDEAGYQITWHSPESVNQTKPVVITFATIRDDKANSGFGTNFLLKHGYETIYVSPSKYSNFQRLSKEEFLELVWPYIVGREVFTYGTSIGGYAAVYYGSVIGANIIAMAPRLSIYPELLINFPEVNDNTYVKRATTPYAHEPLSDVDACLLHEKKAYIIYDTELGPDRFFAEKQVKLALPHASYYSLNFGLHDIPALLLQAGVLKDFLLTALDKAQPTWPLDLSDAAMVLRKKAGDSFRDGRFSDSAKFLRRVLDKKVLIADIELLKELYVVGECSIFPSKEFISDKIRAQIIDKATAETGNTESLSSVLKIHIGMMASLLNFDSAADLSALGKRLYPNDRFFYRRYKFFVALNQRFSN